MTTIFDGAVGFSYKPVAQLTNWGAVYRDLLRKRGYDWEGLREKMKEEGRVRNATLMAFAPEEAPPQVMSSVSPGIEPLRELSWKTKVDSDSQEIPNSADFTNIWDLSDDIIGQFMKAKRQFQEQINNSSPHLFTQKEIDVRMEQFFQRPLKIHFYAYSREKKDA